jgi:hypothetical protein
MTISAKEMGRKSYQTQLEKYGGEKGYREEMKKRGDLGRAKRYKKKDAQA